MKCVRAQRCVICSSSQSTYKLQNHPSCPPPPQAAGLLLDTFTKSHDICQAWTAFQRAVTQYAASPSFTVTARVGARRQCPDHAALHCEFLYAIAWRLETLIMPC